MSGLRLLHSWTAQTIRLVRVHSSSFAIDLGLVGVAILLVLSPLAQAAPNSDQRIESLLAQMTPDEKIGQMVQVDMNALHDKADVQKYFLGSVLSGGDSDPSDNAPETWRHAVEEFKSYALKTRWKAP